MREMHWALALVRQQFHRLATRISTSNFTSSSRPLPANTVSPVQLACGISYTRPPHSSECGQSRLSTGTMQCTWPLAYCIRTFVLASFYHRLCLLPRTASAMIFDTSLSGWACSPIANKYSTSLCNQRGTWPICTRCYRHELLECSSA